MDLNQLLDFHTIIIQCHDNPDADSIASGYALYTFLLSQGKTVRLIYSGRRIVSKPNLKMMLHKLNIPLEYVAVLDIPDLLVTVDCQYKNSNVTYFEAKQVCILDHHIYKEIHASLYDIRPYLTSCSTLLWELLKNVRFDFKLYPNAATALYYGLLTDSNFLVEIRHPLDKDLLDSIDYDKMLIRTFKNSNLSMSDLEIAGMALVRCSANISDKFAVLKAHPCDPNILGFISDLAIQVDDITLCIVYFENDEGIKYSVRSCTKEVKANEFADYVCYGIGSAGGHIDKAGGFINHDAYFDVYGFLSGETFFHDITRTYFADFEIVYNVTATLNRHAIPLYHKKPTLVGYVKTANLFSGSDPILIRTLSNDIKISHSKNKYLVLFEDCSINLFTEKQFNKNFERLDAPYLSALEYDPVVKNIVTYETLKLSKHLGSCMDTRNLVYYAIQLKKNTKFFANLQSESYLTGLKGDYLLIPKKSKAEIRIISQSQFSCLFEELAL